VFLAIQIAVSGSGFIPASLIGIAAGLAYANLGPPAIYCADSRAQGTWCFRQSRGNSDAIMSGFKKMWKKIAALGNLSADVTPHTLRHSFTSLANDLGYSEATIAALVGHKGRTMTSRYIHGADAVLLAAADAVANKTAELMGDIKPGVVIYLPSRAMA
jgi:integrase